MPDLVHPHHVLCGAARNFTDTENFPPAKIDHHSDGNRAFKRNRSDSRHHHCRHRHHGNHRWSRRPARLQSFPDQTSCSPRRCYRNFVARHRDCESARNGRSPRRDEFARHRNCRDSHIGVSPSLAAFLEHLNFFRHSFHTNLSVLKKLTTFQNKADSVFLWPRQEFPCPIRVLFL